MKRTGPLPKWCSNACRHRAWEQARAAESGKAAVKVVDRMVVAVPADGPGWVGHLNVLLGQLGAGPKVIADHQLDDLAAAIELVEVAIAERQHWRGHRRDTWE